MDQPIVKTVNAVGMTCPLPVIETKKALQSMTAPGLVEVLVDNEIASQNVLKLASHKDLAALSERTEDALWRVLISADPTAAPADVSQTAEAPIFTCAPQPSASGTVVVVSSDRMGDGDDALGRILLKSFLFSLTRQDELPTAILFYNGGAYLTCEGSESLEDLKALAEAGTEICTCGTCLDFYGLKDRLAVGSISNMYDIAERQLRAARILRP